MASNGIIYRVDGRAYRWPLFSIDHFQSNTIPNNITLYVMRAYMQLFWKWFTKPITPKYRNTVQMKLFLFLSLYSATKYR